MKDMRPATRQLIDFPLKLGECPVWDAQTQCLWFVDITAPKLHRLDLASGKVESHVMPNPIGSFGLCADHRLVVALRNGVHIFDPGSGALTLLVNPEPDAPHNRLNDGKIGPDGCFWVGSMDDRTVREPIAALYRVTPEGTSARMVDGLRVSNGLAWSADGRKMYHCDTRHEWVTTYDFDVGSGAISNRREICHLNQQQGRPDGAAMDMAGFYWSAGVTAGCLNRIAPNGSIETKVHLPVPCPTMPCFGGADMRTLFVTSLDRPEQAGTVLSFAVDVPGVPVHRFGARG